MNGGRIGEPEKSMQMFDKQHFLYTARTGVQDSLTEIPDWW